MSKKNRKMNVEVAQATVERLSDLESIAMDLNERIHKIVKYDKLIDLRNELKAFLGQEFITDTEEVDLPRSIRNSKSMKSIRGLQKALDNFLGDGMNKREAPIRLRSKCQRIAAQINEKIEKATSKKNKEAVQATN